MSAPAAAPAPAAAAAATAAPAPAAAAPAAVAAPVPEIEGHRVYVGNLAFNATEEQVREHFKKVGGEIVQVLLPTRYKSRRPAGYAFVTFKNEADAKKAVDTLNESEIGDRKIQLELARSKEENAERRQEILDKRRKTQEEKPKAAAAGDAADGDKSAAAKADKQPKKKKAAKTGRRRGPEDGDETAVEPEEDKAKAKKAPKAKSPKEARIDGEPVGDKKAKQPKEEAPKERKPRLALTGETSKTTVFVANLPFNVDDEALSNLFTELSIKVKTAHVIRGLRRLPGRRPFRGSKGFGFVELEDPKQQDEAVEKINGSTVGDRTVSAKIAQEMKAIEEIEADLAKAENASA